MLKKILKKYRYISIIGGGGKTTLMYKLAETSLLMNKPVICSTTTKILIPENYNIIIKNNIDKCFSLLNKNKINVIGKQIINNRKIDGFDKTEYDRIYLDNPEYNIIIEADGSDGRSLKAHKDYEPVIPKKTELVIIVIGIDILDKPFNSKNVHRHELFKKYVEINKNEKIRNQHIIRILKHKKGYLSQISEYHDIMIFISKIKTEKDFELAEKLCYDIKQNIKINHIFYGDLT
jgi:probable selenium-dependent hydroxylase accessory protein YqeC